jgi:hypothetical protein
MPHADAMLDRLPALYRDGELLAGIMAIPGLQLEMVDEDAAAIQRAHWFNSAVDRGEAARLGALLDIAPEPWQGLAEYRAWLHALRNAMLRHGAVTRAALMSFVEEYTAAYRAATGSTVVAPLTSWSETRSGHLAAFVENPPLRRVAHIAATAGIAPLQRFQLDQRGLDDTMVSFVCTGLPDQGEYVPLLANVTTGDALVWLGHLPVGQRLWMRPQADGTVTAELEGRDVTRDLRSISGLVPGTPWNSEQLVDPPRALPLIRGRNDLWFLPVAHFDRPGLDRALLALADLVLAQGRWDDTTFDRALFAQEAGLTLLMTWVETQPATIEITLPAGLMRARTGELEDALVERDRLAGALALAVDRLRPAGVRASVGLTPMADQQGQMDRLVATMPVVQREVAPVGADTLPDAGGLFGVTEFDGSTYR